MTKSEFRMTLKIGEMKVPMILVLSIIAHADCAVAQASQTDLSPKPQTTVEREIESLEEERNKAVLQGDVAALDRMTSDDYTFITLRGELRTKSDILKGFASGSFHYESRQISDLKVRVYGNTDIVTGRSCRKEWRTVRTTAEITGSPGCM